MNEIRKICPRCATYASFKVKTRQFGDGLERKYYECKRCKYMDTISYTNREIRNEMKEQGKACGIASLFTNGKRVKRMMNELQSSIEAQ